MPSKGFTVDTSSRNDVVSFYQAVFKASEGFEHRTIWKDHPATTYAVDFTTAYTFNGLDSEEPLIKNNAASGPRSSGELNLSFVKDVERRVNFYRALVGVPAAVSLMDSDTAKNTSTIDPIIGATSNYDPPLTTTKADAAQQSAYLISRTYIDKWTAGYSTLGVDHVPTNIEIPNLSAWSKEAWNAHRNSNISLGYYGPRAIDEYILEDDMGVDSNGVSKDNREVGHRRKVLATTATNFATGDIPPEYDSTRPPTRPAIRQATNALYVAQRDSEKSGAAPRFVTYPNAGYFPAPLNSPFWSLTHPNANFTGATVTMTDSVGGSITASDLTISSQPEATLSWRVNSASATARNITDDRTFHVTVSNFTVSGVPSSHSFTVTLINPEILTPVQSLTGSAAPPVNGPAAYVLPPTAGAEAIQVSTFQVSTFDWTEDAETATDATSKIIDRTYKGIYTSASNIGKYDLKTTMGSKFNPSFAAFAGTKSFRLSHSARYNPAFNGMGDEIFEMGRDILAGASATFKFVYRRGYMTSGSIVYVETSVDQGLTWQTFGSSITGKSDGTPDTSTQNWSAVLATSTTPYRVRIRLTFTPGAGLYSEEQHSPNPVGIFFDTITTDNCTWLDQKKTNDLAADITKFTLNNASAGVTLTNGSALYLRARAKLGGNWMQYGPSKIVTPTSAPLAGFAGWAAYEYPEVTGGFGGDHDGDGVANAVEFAFYQNPTQANTSSDTINRSANTISIERSIAAQRTGLTYKAEWSDTMAAGSWSQADVVVTFPSGKVVATAPAGTGKRFIRWKFDE